MKKILLITIILFSACFTFGQSSDNDEQDNYVEINGGDYTKIIEDVYSYNRDRLHFFLEAFGTEWRVGADYMRKDPIGFYRFTKTLFYVEVNGKMVVNGSPNSELWVTTVYDYPCGFTIRIWCSEIGRDKVEEYEIDGPFTNFQDFLLLKQRQ